MQTKRKHKSEDEGGSSAGTGVPEPVEAPLSLDDARLLLDYQQRGAVKGFIGPGNATLRDVVRLREAGFIETRADVRGREQVMLTIRGLRRLPEAVQAIAAAPGMRR